VLVTFVSELQDCMISQMNNVTTHTSPNSADEELNLVEDPEFNPHINGPQEGLVTRLKSLGYRILGIEQPVVPEPTEEAIELAIVRRLQMAISVQAKPSTYLYSIHVSSIDRTKAAKIANTLADVYIADQVAVKFEATEFAIDWLSERVVELEQEVAGKEDELKSLRAETELVSLEALEATSIRAKDLRQRVEDARIAIVSLDVDIAAWTTMLEARAFDELAVALVDPILDRFLSGAKAGNATSVSGFLGRVELLIDQRKRERARAVAQRDALQASLSGLEQQIEVQNADLIQINQLVREAQATQVLYETFLTRLKETSVQVGLLQSDSRVMSAAVRGGQIAPRTLLIVAAAALFGFLLGAAILLRRQFANTGFHTTDDLEAMTGLTVAGQVPVMPIKRREKLLAYLTDKPTSPASEAIRNLRTSILMSDFDAPPKVILSTSSIPGEGKTTQSIALAHNLAGLGKSVLLMECDIRRRTLGIYFQASSDSSLLSVLSGKETLEDAVTTPARFDGVDLLLGDKSTQNAADLFSSTEFQDVMSAARAKYDYVILDTPPVLVVPDARILSRVADYVLYNVKWNSTGRNQVLAGLRELQSVGISASGLALTQINARQMKSLGYGDGYGAYAKYGKGYYDT